MSLLLLAATPAQGEISDTLTASQRAEILGQAANAIEKTYYDVRKATVIAAQLRAYSQRSESSRLTDKRALAGGATDLLQQFDGHFALVWGHSTAAQPGAAISPIAQWEAQGNFGVEEVRRLAGNVGYINLNSFAQLDLKDPGSPARRAADAAMTLTEKSSALIIDLRNNGGGSSDMVAYLISYLLPDEPFLIIRAFGRGGKLEEESWAPAVSGRRRPDLPLYLLTSGRTPSAAESFIYALRHSGRKITVVGERTAGEANPVAYHDVGHGFTAQVPFAQPIDPRTDSNWEKIGIIPDAAVTSEQAFHQAHRMALSGILGGETDPVKRLEPQWALDALQAELKAIPFEPSDFEGRYGSRRILWEGSHLTYARQRWPALPLLHVGGGEFTVTSRPDLRIRFVRQNGKVASLEEASARGRTIAFPRDTDNRSAQ